MAETKNGQCTLVLGGARSGKSHFAQSLAEQSEGHLIYVATAAAHDEEMRDRIARHKTDRDSRWRTVEEEIDLAAAIRRESGKSASLLVDCLTLWLSNLMLGGQDVAVALDGLVAAMTSFEGRLILVSNEVGSGIVPETPLGREFRDASGRMNQLIAAKADGVALVVAGLPLWLKGG